jgi:hypothetical protein
MIKLEELRKLAMSFPEITEEPHSPKSWGQVRKDLLIVKLLLKN